MLANLLSFLWGFAEATLFFIIPDVIISFVALQGYTFGIESSLYALGGALLGGSIMFYWGRSSLEKILLIFLKLPAIRQIDLERVRKDMQKYDSISMMWGPTLGIPYKIYAVYAHLFSSFWFFILISIPARMIRFVLVAVTVPVVMESLFSSASFPMRFSILLVIWIVIYVAYFYIKRK